LKREIRHPSTDNEATNVAARSAFSRREFLGKTVAAGAGFAAATALAESLGGLSPEAAAAADAPFNPYPPHPTWTFTLVNHVTTSEFFVPSRYGAQDACDLFGCRYQWVGSVNSIVTEMVDAMNAAIDAKVDGIGVPVIDPHAFIAPTNRALAAGIPVIAYNTAAPTTTASQNLQMAYIGQSLFQAGQLMGKQILSRISRGHIVLFNPTPGTLNLQARVNGVNDVIKASGKPITIDNVASAATLAPAVSAVKAYYAGHPNLAGMFCVDTLTMIGIIEVMKEHGLRGKIATGCFDTIPQVVAGIVDGYVDFTIYQQPYLQGFYTIMELFLYKLSGGLNLPASIETGLSLITKSNVGQFAKYTDRYEGSSSAEKVVPEASGPIVVPPGLYPPTQLR
jgi:simple sugar transport system substrate-binding protein